MEKLNRDFQNRTTNNKKKKGIHLMGRKSTNVNLLPHRICNGFMTNLAGCENMLSDFEATENADK